MSEGIRKILQWVKGLSFRTGVINGGVSIACYAISFMQMLLPITMTLKGILWVVFFGMAKACQYTAILILGKEGIRRIKKYWQ